MDLIKQISYCFVAKMIGDKGQPNLMADELDEGMICVWMSYENAMEMMSLNRGDNERAREYMVVRDTVLLEKAKGQISNIMPTV